MVHLQIHYPYVTMPLEKHYSKIEGPWKREAIEQVVREWDLQPAEVGYVGDIVYDMIS